MQFNFCQKKFVVSLVRIHFILDPDQCSGSGSFGFGPSGSGYIIICTDRDLDLDLDPAQDTFINKQKIRKSLEFCFFVTLNDLLSLKTDVNVPTVRNNQKTYFFGIMTGTYEH
jgi:hypothetical protein